jgi:general secretion pathway protein J
MSRPARFHRARVSGGFTLVELLVSVLVFSLMAATAYTALNSLTGAASDYRQRADELAEMQRAVATLDADLRQLVSRLGRHRDGRLLPAMQGDSSAFLARRAGRANPAGLPRSDLQQIRWLGLSPGLQRQSWPEVDSTPSSEPSGRTTYVSIERIEFRYLDRSGIWHARWPTGPQDALPAAVEYVIETSRHGAVRRLVAL